MQRQYVTTVKMSLSEFARFSIYDSEFNVVHERSGKLIHLLLKRDMHSIPSIYLHQASEPFLFYFIIRTIFFLLYGFAIRNALTIFILMTCK